MRRSDFITLTVAGVAVATAVVFAPEEQQLERKRYSDRLDCECDYSAAQCQWEDGATVGPWYAVDEAVRRLDPTDPGRGHCGHSSGITQLSRAFDSGRRGSVTTESGSRGGFGGTAMRGASGRG